ncbi:succinylglutamate desuccinylase/aspartoacylase family protein, partial [Rhizobium johnstonii]
SIVDRATLTEDLDDYPATDRLKSQLLHMALGADLVLDLHCDDESLQYAYIDEAFWPEAADLAAALEMDAVLLSDGESSAFEEAFGFAWKYEVPGERRPRLPGQG